MHIATIAIGIVIAGAWSASAAAQDQSLPVHGDNLPPIVEPAGDKGDQLRGSVELEIAAEFLSGIKLMSELDIKAAIGADIEQLPGDGIDRIITSAVRSDLGPRSLAPELNFAEPPIAPLEPVVGYRLFDEISKQISLDEVVLQQANILQRAIALNPFPLADDRAESRPFATHRTGQVQTDWQ